MAYFQTKNIDLGKFCRVLKWKMHILWPFGLSYGHLVFLWPYGAFYGHLVYYLPFWYFVPRKIWQP
jgi:hypothetical protein